ncbi:hypothetical protein Afil01_39260 [Actinorhabdospora filicis]|uniref:N-acetyltransferase domain-containing protein n=1 Tax=Actinorhabdospora filicis TaxID=1785913 RepID=A0A9W6SNI1_9ACTN|nr:GNAT family N-acetyltransferase [Actinorhabdospora filicis]GLZ79119.1 hypothetical protein Afil01_39260 [Actinorhabdospora filicis]
MSGYTLELLPELGPERFAELTGHTVDPFETGRLGVTWMAKDVYFAVREPGGRLVAAAGVARVPVTAGGAELDIAGLGTVIVSPTERGRGLARVAVGGIMDHARDVLGLDLALLFCLPTRVPVYERLGWTLVEGEVTAHQPGGEIVMPARTMRRVLREGAEWPEGALALRSLPM